MAEGDIIVYNDFKEQILLGIHDLSATGLTVTLHTAYTPNIDSHQVWANVSATEYGTASGYTAGGIELASLAVTQDDANDRSAWDAANAVWSSLGALTPATPSHAIIWNDTPISPVDPLVCYVELGVTATNGGDYTLAWHSDGILLLS